MRLLLTLTLCTSVSAAAQPVGAGETFCPEVLQATDRVGVVIDATSATGPLGPTDVVLSYGTAPSIDTFSVPAARPVVACSAAVLAHPIAQAVAARLARPHNGPGEVPVSRELWLVRLSRTLTPDEQRGDWAARRPGGRVDGVLVAVAGDVALVARPAGPDVPARLGASRQLLRADDGDVLAAGRTPAEAVVLVLGENAAQGAVTSWRAADPSRALPTVSVLRLSSAFMFVGSHRPGVEP